jgi:hypothetical protein
LCLKCSAFAGGRRAAGANHRALLPDERALAAVAIWRQLCGNNAVSATPCPPAMPAAPVRKSKSATLPGVGAEPRLSRTRRPETLPVADWQAALRRQFGREQPFALRILGAEPVFSTFRVDNPGNGTHYRVTIRGLAPGHNQCTCWDYATNHLGIRTRPQARCSLPVPAVPCWVTKWAWARRCRPLPLPS